MHLAGHAQLEEPAQRPLHVALAQQGDEFVAQPHAGQVAHQVHVHAALGEALGLLVHAEAVAVLVAHGAEDPGGVLDEAQVVEHADDAVAQVAEAAEEVDDRAEVRPAQRDGHGVDGEIAAEQVLADGGVLHPGQRGRIVVELGAGGGHVDVEGLARTARSQAGASPRTVGRKQHHRGLELAVGAHPAPQFGGQAGGELDAVALHRDVDVDVGLLQQQVADEPAHQIDAGEVLRQSRAGPEQPSEERVVGQRLHGVDLRRGRLRLLLLPAALVGGQHVGAGGDADHVRHPGGAVRAPPLRRPRR